MALPLHNGSPTRVYVLERSWVTPFFFCYCFCSVVRTAAAARRASRDRRRGHAGRPPAAGFGGAGSRGVIPAAPRACTRIVLFITYGAIDWYVIYPSRSCNQVLRQYVCLTYHWRRAYVDRWMVKNQNAFQEAVVLLLWPGGNRACNFTDLSESGRWQHLLALWQG